MSSTLTLARDQIDAGHPFDMAIPVTVSTGATVQSVSAYLTNVGSNKDNVTAVVITTPVTLTLVDGNWTGTMPATETAKLLSDPNDGKSVLQYPQVYLALNIAIAGGASGTLLTTQALKVGRNLLWAGT